MDCVVSMHRKGEISHYYETNDDCDKFRFQFIMFKSWSYCSSSWFDVHCVDKVTTIISDACMLFANRTHIHQLPTIGGRAVDLFQLYRQVTMCGGWSKVSVYVQCCKLNTARRVLQLDARKKLWFSLFFKCNFSTDFHKRQVYGYEIVNNLFVAYLGQWRSEMGRHCRRCVHTRSLRQCCASFTVHLRQASTCGIYEFTGFWLLVFNLKLSL